MLDFLIPNNYCWLAISGHVFSPITQYKFLTIRIFFFWHSCHFQKLLILCFWLSVPPVSKDFKAKFHLSFRSMHQNHGVYCKKCEIEINYFWLIQISFGELFFLLYYNYCSCFCWDFVLFCEWNTTKLKMKNIFFG